MLNDIVFPSFEGQKQGSGIWYGGDPCYGLRTNVFDWLNYVCCIFENLLSHIWLIAEQLYLILSRSGDLGDQSKLGCNRAAPKAKTPICWKLQMFNEIKALFSVSSQLTFTEAMRNKARLSITGSVGENGRVLTPDCPKAVHAGPPLHQSSGLALVSSELP